MKYSKLALAFMLNLCRARYKGMLFRDRVFYPIQRHLPPAMTERRRESSLAFRQSPLAVSAASRGPLFTFRVTFPTLHYPYPQ